MAVVKQKKQDGIDIRIRTAQKFLTKHLNKKQMHSLDFTKAVVHKRDSLAYYVKVPYRKNGTVHFMMIRNEAGKMAFVNVEIDILIANNKLTGASTIKTWRRMFNNAPDRVTNYKIDYKGQVTQITENGKLKNEVDSIYKVVTLVTGLQQSGKPMQLYLNASLMLDDMTALNRKARQNGIIVQDIVPIRFSDSNSFELEYDNSKVLPAIDIKEAFKKFSNKPDSVKQR